jgi:hypothetical protein
MQAEGKVDGHSANGPERRTHPRHPVDEDATLLILSQGSPLPCHLLELSLEGCRLRTKAPFLAGIEIRVEVAFRINGIALRFSGVTAWTLDKHVVGVHFVGLTSRRRDELADVLGELAADLASAAKKRAAGEVSDPPQAKVPATGKPTPEPVLTSVAQPATRQPAIPAPQSSPRPTVPPHAPSPAKRDRRTQSRHAVDTSAVILLIKIGSQIPGRIQDLSLGGCRIHTNEPFPVGIYTRVETEFHLEGLPFRLGGVIQAVHDKGRQLVGIRFLDMSERKREQVEQLIQEIDEAEKTRNGESA